MAMAIALLRQHGFSRLAQLIFATLYLSSSIYLYWNRAFMIESTALFFTLTALFLYGRSLRTIDDLTPLRRLLSAAGFALSLTVAMLVKATTALPVFLLISCHLLWHLLRPSILRSPILLANSLTLLAGVVIAFFALREWTHHADALKSLNPYGLNLTSTALQGWNFGNLQQRFSADLWQGVVINRMMTKEAWLPLALLLTAALWQLRRDRSRIACILVCILLAIMPLLMFSNLHIVHNYYQSANHVFLLLAIAGSGALVLERPLQPALIQLIAAAILLFYLVSDGKGFTKDYLDLANKQSDEKLEISRLINKSTDASSAVLVLGDDWFSSFPYLSRRRALVLPSWYEKGPFSEQGVLSDPSARLKPYRLGAIVTDKPLSNDVLARICPSAQQAAPVDEGRWTLYVCPTGPKA
jgi:4-amino-4-deoxy-L-arabinose transferase-like glycosyltransferase